MSGKSIKWATVVLAVVVLASSAYIYAQSSGTPPPSFACPLDSGCNSTAACAVVLGGPTGTTATCPGTHWVANKGTAYICTTPGPGTFCAQYGVDQPKPGGGTGHTWICANEYKCEPGTLWGCSDGDLNSSRYANDTVCY